MATHISNEEIIIWPMPAESSEGLLSISGILLDQIFDQGITVTVFEGVV